MAWNSLVGGAAGEPGSGPRMRIEFLESENARLASQLEDMTVSRENLLKVRNDARYL